LFLGTPLAGEVLIGRDEKSGQEKGSTTGWCIKEPALEKKGVSKTTSCRTISVRRGVGGLQIYLLRLEKPCSGLDRKEKERSRRSGRIAQEIRLEQEKRNKVTHFKERTTQN